MTNNAFFEGRRDEGERDPEVPSATNPLACRGGRRGQWAGGGERSGGLMGAKENVGGETVEGRGGGRRFSGRLH